MKTALSASEIYKMLAPEKLSVMNRAEKRSWNRGRYVARNGRPPTKTGQPDWFVDAMEKHREKRVRIALERHSRKYLSKIPVGNLVEHAGQPAKLMQAIEPVYPTVWALSQGRLTTLLAIPGVKPGALRKLRQALVVKGVTVKWGAP